MSHCKKRLSNVELIRKFLPLDTITVAYREQAPQAYTSCSVSVLRSKLNQSFIPYLSGCIDIDLATKALTRSRSSSNIITIEVARNCQRFIMMVRIALSLRPGPNGKHTASTWRGSNSISNTIFIVPATPCGTPPLQQHRSAIAHRPLSDCFLVSNLLLYTALLVKSVSSSQRWKL